MVGDVDRAVAVAFIERRVLVVRRRRQGRDYCVLPGGGVEPGESPREAAIRELREETGLTGHVERQLWTIRHEDRTAHYFLVSAGAGPVIVGGPEALIRSDVNVYLPEWLPVGHLVRANLQPTILRARLVDELDAERGQQPGSRWAR